MLLQSADTGREARRWPCVHTKFDVDLLREFEYLVADTKRALGVVNVTLAEPGRFRYTG